MYAGALGKVEIVEPAKKGSGKFAVYLARDPSSVLLTDGVWTDQRNCFKGPLQLKPQLFDTQRAAFRRADPQRHIVREYDGPLPENSSR